MTVYHTSPYTHRSVQEIQDAMRRAARERAPRERAARAALRAAHRTRLQDGHVEVVGTPRLARYINTSVAYVLIIAPHSVTGTPLYARGLRLIHAVFGSLAGLLPPHELPWDTYHLYVWTALAADLRPFVCIIVDEDWTVGAGVRALYDRCVRAGLLVYGVGPDGCLRTAGPLVRATPSAGQARYTVSPGAPFSSVLQGPTQGPAQGPAQGPEQGAG